MKEKLHLHHLEAILANNFQQYSISAGVAEKKPLQFYQRVKNANTSLNYFTLL